LSPSDKHSNPKLEKPENLKEEATKNVVTIGQTLKPKKKKRPRREDERLMKKLGIRRLDATSSHLVKSRI
jgi:hypothetical protein